MKKRKVYTSVAKIVKNSRGQVYEAVKDLTAAQWMMIPEGHDNNIAWNIGHLIWAHIGLTYGRSDLVAPIDREPYLPLYGIGSSPATWAAEPNTAELLKIFMNLPDQMIADAKAGVFNKAEFVPWKTGSGAEFKTLLDMMIYNVAHEGEHRGMILALKNLVA